MEMLNINGLNLKLENKRVCPVIKLQFTKNYVDISKIYDKSESNLFAAIGNWSRIIKDLNKWYFGQISHTDTFTLIEITVFTISTPLQSKKWGHYQG